MKRWLIRLRYRWLSHRAVGDNINRRVQVENWLINCAKGEKPLPDAETCMWLALRLGVPSQLWNDYLKDPPKK